MDNCSIKPWQQALSSCTGGFITSLLVTPLDVIKVRLQAQQKLFKSTLNVCNNEMTPLDVVKTRLQVQQKPFSKGQCFLYCNGLWDHLCFCVENGLTTTYKPWYKKPSHFNGTLDAFIKITKNEGPLSLWSGLSPTLIMAIPATMVYFTAYDQIKYRLGYRDNISLSPNKNNKYQQFVIPVLSGAIARVGAVTIISPLELIRTKLQSVKMNYHEVFLVLKSDLKTNGFVSLWRGWTPTILRDVPFSALYWLNYEYLKSRFITYDTTSIKSYILISLVCGALSGTVAAFLTTPFDVIKTHRQIKMGEIEVQHLDLYKSESTFTLMKNLFRSNGLKGLYAGVVPRMIKVAPACAIMISTYEYGKLFFNSYNQKKKNLTISLSSSSAELCDVSDKYSHNKILDKSLFPIVLDKDSSINKGQNLTIS